MSDPYGHTTMLRRVRLVELDDAGTQQKMRLAGLKGEELAGIPRVQHFGLSSNPPVDSEGILLALGGRSDRSMVIGVENPGMRPTAREAGSTIIYDANGNVASFVQAEIRIKSAQKIVLQVGGNSITLDASGITIVGGGITHDGKNIGKTHVHTGVQSGPSNTGAPA